MICLRYLLYISMLIYQCILNWGPGPLHFNSGHLEAVSPPEKYDYSSTCDVFFPPSCMCIRWIRVGFSWKLGFRTAVSYKSSYKPYMMKYDVCHTFLSHQATHILRDFAFAVFCNHLQRDLPRLEQDVSTPWWYFNLWCNSNKRKTSWKLTSWSLKHVQPPTYSNT